MLFNYNNFIDGNNQKENNWKPVGLGDLLDAKQVKLAYRKAMLVVHPDRCSGMDAETKFTCMAAKRVLV